MLRGPTCWLLIGLRFHQGGPERSEECIEVIVRGNGPHGTRHRRTSSGKKSSNVRNEKLFKFASACFENTPGYQLNRERSDSIRADNSKTFVGTIDGVAPFQGISLEASSRSQGPAASGLLSRASSDEHAPWLACEVMAQGESVDHP